MRDENQKIIAGCNGSIIFGVVYTDQLWVNPSYRKSGIGRDIMEKVHQYARSVGCAKATVNTMDFQNSRI